MIRRNGLLLLLLLVPPALNAQDKPELVYDSTGQLVPVGRVAATPKPTRSLPTREGLWLSLGLGIGTVGCSYVCSSPGAALDLAAGWSLSPRLLLGAGVTGWTKDGPTGEYEGARIRITVGSVALRARFYPTRSAGFFLSGGLGLGLTRLSDERGTGHTQTGVGFLAGMGGDLRVSPRMSLTPFADFSTIHSGVDDLRDDLWRMGLGVTFH
jgi:hypothetical protein